MVAASAAASASPECSALSISAAETGSWLVRSHLKQTVDKEEGGGEEEEEEEGEEEEEEEEEGVACIRSCDLTGTRTLCRCRSWWSRDRCSR